MAKGKLRYRLGLDLGTNSIGWFIYELSENNEICRVVRSGVRIFSEGRDPQSKASLAGNRRLARSTRRRRDRYLARRNKLLNLLVRIGLLPTDLLERQRLVYLDPYPLRKLALDQPLPAEHLGRILFHLNQRRGFQSNRRVDRGDNEKGKISTAQTATLAEIAKTGARTYGEWLALRHEERNTVRARKRGMGKNERYELYASRGMLQHEFDEIIKAQRRHHESILTNDNIRGLRETIFTQRPLKPVEPGKCTLDPNEKRAALALPSVQRFRIYQELNNLRISEDVAEQPLTLEQRDFLAEKLERTARAEFDRIRRWLKLTARFNLESIKRKDLKGNSTSATLSKKEHFGEQWHGFSHQLQDEIVDKLLSIESEEELVQWLCTKTNITANAAVKVAEVALPDGYGRLGHRTIRRILPHLIGSVCSYDSAVVAAGFDSHSQFGDGEILPHLPYYGERLGRYVMNDSGNPEDSTERRYGRIGNPTVHVALNQLRYLVNAMIEHYGHPSEIVVETARDLPLGALGRSELEKEQKKNQDLNDNIRAELNKLGQPANGENVTRYKLWLELNDNVADRRCPYSGTQISLAMLFSDAIEVEHILPFKQTFDDSIANKTLCTRQANRDKGNSIPYEAFGPEGHHRSGYNWDEILQRAAHLKRRRGKRFGVNALADFLKNQDFLARQLNDTRYISRIAREYLSAICPVNKVSVVPGRLTALLRGKWGLNKILSDSGVKQRDDHRHHAIDAAVVGATDRPTLQRLATASERAGALGMNRLVEKMPTPWETFHADVEASIKAIVVSHRPDHSPLKQLHNDTAYGIIDGPDKRGVHRVVHRVPITSLKESDFDKLGILDPALERRLRIACEGKAGTALRDALMSFSEATGTRRVKIVENLSIIPIVDRRDGHTVYKGYKGDSNYCIEIFKSSGDRWESEIISTYHACRVAVESPQMLRQSELALNREPLVMRLCRDDLVALEEQLGSRRLLRVVKISAPGTVVLCSHTEANVDKHNRVGEHIYVYKSAASLQAARARRVTLDPLGWVVDRGFRP